MTYKHISHTFLFLFILTFGGWASDGTDSSDEEDTLYPISSPIRRLFLHANCDADKPFAFPNAAELTDTLSRSKDHDGFNTFFLGAHPDDERSYLCIPDAVIYSCKPEAHLPKGLSRVKTIMHSDVSWHGMGIPQTKSIFHIDFFSMNSEELSRYFTTFINASWRDKFVLSDFNQASHRKAMFRIFERTFDLIIPDVRVAFYMDSTAELLNDFTSLLKVGGKMLIDNNFGVGHKNTGIIPDSRKAIDIKRNDTYNALREQYKKLQNEMDSIPVCKDDIRPEIRSEIKQLKKDVDSKEIQQEIINALEKKLRRLDAEYELIAPPLRVIEIRTEIDKISQKLNITPKILPSDPRYVEKIYNPKLPYLVMIVGYHVTYTNKSYQSLMVSLYQNYLDQWTRKHLKNCLIQYVQNEVPYRHNTHFSHDKGYVNTPAHLEITRIVHPHSSE